MTTATEAPTLDWNNAQAKYSEPIVKEIGDITVSTGDAWVIGAGEYAAEGEPTLIVTVNHAIDSDGNDLRERLAGVIADAIRSFGESRK